MYVHVVTSIQYLLIFSFPCWPALRGEGSGNSLGGRLASPRGTSHSQAEDGCSGTHYDWRALMGVAENNHSNVHACIMYVNDCIEVYNIVHNIITD